MSYTNASPWICAAMTALAVLGCSKEKPSKEGTEIAGMPSMMGGVGGAIPGGNPAGTGSTPVAGGGGTAPIGPAGAGGMMVVGGSGGMLVAGAGGTMNAGGDGGAMMAGSGGMSPAGDGGVSGDGGAPPMGGESGCTPAPSGMFETTTEGGGPGGNYVIYRPRTLGEGGFVHPPVAWGNGLATVPSNYDALLKNVASHGFVVIANPGTGSDPQVVRQGLEWLLAQNESGMYAGKLAVDCAATIGYSMGGGAAVGSGSHPAVKAVVSIHGLQDASDKISGPLLLTTSDDDGFVTPQMFVQPCYDRSSVQPTIMATYVTGNAPSFNGHLTPLGDGQQDAEPMIAWLRFWLYGDQAQRKWFFGADCTLCTKPWGMVQKKNYDWD